MAVWAVFSSEDKIRIAFPDGQQNVRTQFADPCCKHSQPYLYFLTNQYLKSLCKTHK